MFISFITVIFLLAVGISFAYFSTIFNVEGEPTDITTTTGVLHLTYVDGAEIKVSRIFPGHKIIKEISVENDGTFETSYALSWKELVNDITNNELVIYASCVQSYEGETSGACDGIESTAIGDSPSIIKDGIPIDVGYKHTYTLTIEFLEAGSEQNYNQGKNFGGVLQVNGSDSMFRARIASTYYDTLADAIEEVPNDNTQTTIKLLSSIDEDVSIPENKNVIIDFNYQKITGFIRNSGITEFTGNGKITKRDESLALNSNNKVVKLNNNVYKMVTSMTDSLIFNHGTLTLNNINIFEGEVASSVFNRLIDNTGTMYINNADINSTNITISNQLTGILYITGGSIINNSTDGERTLLNNGTATISGGILTNSGVAYPVIANNKILTISDETNIYSISTAIVNGISTSQLTITGGTTTTTANRSTIINNDNSTLLMTGGIVSNSTETGGTSLSNDGTATISGGTISNNNAAIVNILNTNSLTINGTSTINSESNPILNSGGTVDISGGTINATGASGIHNGEDSTLNISGGTINGLYANGTVAIDNAGSTYITGGTISNIGVNASVLNNHGYIKISSNPIINSETNILTNHSNSDADIQGGTLTTITDNTSGATYPVIYVMENSTLDITGGTIRNNTIATSYNFMGSSIILNEGQVNMSGGSITGTDKSYAFIENNNILNISGTASITGPAYLINCVAGTVTISGGTLTTNSNNTLLYNGADGTINVSGGNLTNNNTEVGQLIYNLGNMTLSGGTYRSLPPNTVAINNANTLTVSNVNVSTESMSLQNNTGATTTINSGTFNVYNDENPVLWNNENATMYINGGTFKNNTDNGVSFDNKGTAVVTGGSFENKGSTYVTVSNTGGTLTLSGSASITSPGSNALANLADSTININGGSYYSSLNSTIQNFGLINMTSGIVQNTNAEGGNTIYNGTGGEFNVSGGSVTNQNSSVIDVINDTGATLRVSGTAQLTSYSHVISNLGTVYIQGGTVTGKSYATIYNQAGSTFNMSSGTLTNDSASGTVFANYGTAYFSGGSVTHFSTTNYMSDNYGTITVSGTANISSTSNAIVIRSGGRLNVNGGTVSGSGNGSPTVFVLSGGIFSMTAGTVNNTNGGYAAYNQGGTASVSGGTCTPRNF